MSKCQINKYKAGSFSPEKKSQNGSLDTEFATKLAARNAQDSQLWGKTPATSNVQKSPKSQELSILVQKPSTKINDIHTILEGDF